MYRIKLNDSLKTGKSSKFKSCKQVLGEHVCSPFRFSDFKALVVQTIVIMKIITLINKKIKYFIINEP
jgi:hypothetical protein